MASSKKSVDEIWKELNKRPAPRAVSAGIGSSIPGVTSTTRVLSSSTASSAAALGSASGEGIQDVHIGPATTASRRPGAMQYDLVKAGVSSEELQAYLSDGVQRLINCLSDQDRGTRREAALKLQIRLLQGVPGTPAASPQLLQALVCGPLLHPLVGLLSDSVERCRSVAAQLLTDAVQRIADVAPLVPALVPELAQRMGILPVAEPGEEVRLQLILLVAALINKAEPRLLATCTGDLSLVLCRALEDTFHDIKKAACGAVTVLAAAVPPASLEPHSERLLQALIANLSHQHSRVRSACIAAMDALLPRGVAAPGVVETIVAPGVRPIAYDRSPAVREALFVALAHWLGYEGAAAGTAGTTAAPAAAAPGLAAAYAPWLLPILLVGVTDPQASIAEQALQLVEDVGAIWDHHREAASSTATSSQPSTPQDEPMHDTAPQFGDDGATTDPAASAAAQLPPPYHGRPGAGCRRMIRALLPQLLLPLIKELTEWTVSLRASAARSLHTMLVMAEDAVTPHLPALLPALCGAIGDEEVEVAARILRCVHVLGAHVRAQYSLPLLLDHLTSPRISVGQRANALVVLSGLLHASAGAKQGGSTQVVMPDDLVCQLALALASDELRGSDHPAVRMQLLAAAQNLMRTVGPQLELVSLPMYLLVLHLYGHEQDTARQQAIRAAMQELAVHCGVGSFEALGDWPQPGLATGATGAPGLALADHLLATIAADAQAWTADSSSYAVFKALLLTSGPSTLDRLLPSVVRGVMQPVLGNADKDANLRLSMLQLLDMLLEDPARGPSFGGHHAATVLRDVLVPPLTWRAGKVAAAVRFAACTALSTMLSRCLVPAEALLEAVSPDAPGGSLLPIIHQCLDEDWYTDVRSTSCFVMEQLLLAVGSQLSQEQRRAVYPELLKRLDDSSNAVRIATCRALVAFSQTLVPDYCDTNSGYLAAGVVIHMDDSDPAVQEAACCALEALAVVKPSAVATEVRKVYDRFRAKHYCDRVLALCG